nr:MAG TPA: hypothetical protein [Caudoviricetes sp.]
MNNHNQLKFSYFAKFKRKSLRNVDFIGFLYVILFYFCKHNVLAKFW